MEDKELIGATTAAIASSFEIEGYDSEQYYSADEVLQILTKQVEYMMEHRFERLMSLMYTMDVNQAKVEAALSPICKEPAAQALAKLIFERQKQRVFTKNTFKQKGPADWEDF